MDPVRQEQIRQSALGSQSPTDDANIALYTLMTIPKAAVELQQFFAYMRGNTMTTFPSQGEPITDADVQKVLHLMQNGYDVRVIQNAENLNGHYAKTEDADAYLQQYAHYNGSVLRVFPDGQLWIKPETTDDVLELHGAVPASVIFYVYIVFCVFTQNDAVIQALRENEKLVTVFRTHPMLSLIYTVIQLSKCWRNLTSDGLTTDNKLKIKEKVDRVVHNYETRNSRSTNARYTPKNRDEPGARQGDDEDTYEISAVLEFMQTLYDELLPKLRDALRASAESQSTIEMEVDPDPRDDGFRLRLTLPHGVGSTRRNVPGMFFGNR